MIEQEIKKNVDELFTQIFQLLDQKFASSHEKRRLNICIKQLMYKLKGSVSREFKNIKLDKAKREHYWSYWEELCQQKKQEAEAKIDWLKGNYEIPLLKYSQVEIKDTNSSAPKLRQGGELHHFKNTMHRFWVTELPYKLETSTNSVNAEQKTLLLRQFIVGLIFDCGCAHRKDLVAIIQSMLDSYSLYIKNDSPELLNGLVSIYSSKSIKTGFVYSYPIMHKRYASIYIDQTGYVTKQIYLTPVCLFILLRLVDILLNEMDQNNQEEDQLYKTMLAIVGEGSDALDQYISEAINEIDSNSDLGQIFAIRKYKAFEHIDYLQWFGQKNHLDGFLNALHQGAIQTSCLSLYLLRELNTLSMLDDNQLQQRMQRRQASSQNKKIKIEYKKIPTQELDLEKANVEVVRKSFISGVRGRVKAQVLRDIEDDLKELQSSYEQRHELSAKDIALVVVQKCLLEWYRHRLQVPFGGKSLALSSLDTYKSAFVRDLFYYVVSNEFNLLEMDEAQFEQLYESILLEKQYRDELKTKRDKRKIVSKHNTIVMVKLLMV